MKNEQLANYSRRVLKLEGFKNIRDMGGLNARDQQTTGFKKYLRSDNPLTVSPESLSFLLEYGLGADLDLRTFTEAELRPDIIAQQASVDYKHVSLIDAVYETHKFTDGHAHNFSMSDLYISFFEEGKKAIKACFDFFWEHRAKTVLFHCSQGKDRTAVIAMLLLKLAGCSNKIIVDDYMCTNFSIEALTENIFMGRNFDFKMLAVKRAYMEKTLKFFDRKYKNPEHYFISADISADKIYQLKKYILE
jgi:protein-tyrosine phosphatase